MRQVKTENTHILFNLGLLSKDLMEHFLQGNDFPFEVPATKWKTSVYVLTDINICALYIFYFPTNYHIMDYIYL